MATVHQIKAIYALASGLGINRNSHDDELHELVYCITGKESIKELTNSEANSVQTELMGRMKGVDNINRSGSKKKHIDVPPGKMTEAQQRKAWRLIYKLQELDPSSAAAAERMRGAVNKILGTDINTNSQTPFRMISVSDGRKLIDALKRYVSSAEKKLKDAGA